RQRTEPNDIVYRLAERAATVVTDDYPTFIARDHNARVPGRIGRAFHAVDSSCVVPMNLLPKREWAAYTIRPKLQKLLPKYLKAPEAIRVKHRWTAPQPAWHVTVTGENIGTLVASCEIDHSIKPSLTFQGGSSQAHKHLREFL